MTETASYLVQYGRLAFVGRFEAAGGFKCARGDRVVIRGPCGLEIGAILLEASASMPLEGPIVRVATPDDHSASRRQHLLGQEILAAAESSGLPISFIDSEVSLDGQTASLHALPWVECDAAPLLAQLSQRFGLDVSLFDLSRIQGAKDPPDPEKASCGKPDCGSGSGGCGTCSAGSGGCASGSCSRGSAKSAEQLGSYFAELRQKMEAAGLARTELEQLAAR